MYGSTRCRVPPEFARSPKPRERAGASSSLTVITRRPHRSGTPSNACEHAADDAMIVLHALASPDVAKGLDVLRSRRLERPRVSDDADRRGSLAWDRCVPIAHTPDPAVVWSLPGHLAKYPVSGESSEQEERRPSLQLAAVDREAARHEEEIVRLEHDLSSQVVEASGLHGGLGARDAWLASRSRRVGTPGCDNPSPLGRRDRLERECTALRELARPAREIRQTPPRELSRMANPDQSADVRSGTQRSEDVSRLSANVVSGSSRRYVSSTNPLRGGSPRPCVASRTPDCGSVRMLHRTIVAVARFRRIPPRPKDDVALVSRSGLFDRQYYVTQVPATSVSAGSTPSCTTSLAGGRSDSIRIRCSPVRSTLNKTRG